MLPPAASINPQLPRHFGRLPEERFGGFFVPLFCDVMVPSFATLNGRIHSRKLDIIFVVGSKLFRRPDILVGRLRFYRDSIFFFFLLFRQLPSELAERNSTKTGHMLESKCSLKMHVRNLGNTLPLQIGGPKTTFFDDFDRNLTATI